MRLDAPLQAAPGRDHAGLARANGNLVIAEQEMFVYANGQRLFANEAKGRRLVHMERGKCAWSARGARLSCWTQLSKHVRSSAGITRIAGVDGAIKLSRTSSW